MAKKEKSTDTKTEQREEEDLAYTPPPAAWDEAEDEGSDEAEDDDEYEDDEYEAEDDDEYEAEGDDEFDDEDDAYDDKDPTWYTPHLVLVALLILGLLGYIGAFNKSLRPLFTKHRAAQIQAQAKASKAAAPAAAKKAKPAAVKARPKVQPKKPEGAIYGAKHILVAYKGARRASPKIKRSKDDAKKLAAKIAKQARADIKGWPKLVEKHSDEPGAARRQGDLGRFRRGSMVPQFQTAVEKLKVGGVSDVVETAFGYHVIWRTL